MATCCAGALAEEHDLGVSYMDVLRDRVAMAVRAMKTELRDTVGTQRCMTARLAAQFDQTRDRLSRGQRDGPPTPTPPDPRRDSFGRCRGE
jgi:hypothetical protein